MDLLGFYAIGDRLAMGFVILGITIPSLHPPIFLVSLVYDTR
jgi:hypothetical protein